MSETENTTFSIPRFLNFIELGYLLEAAKVSDEYFSAKISATTDESVVSNLNATRQSLLRAVFISSYAMLEQSLDELVIMEQEKCGAKISPKDLRHNGVKRSLTYAVKVLNKDLDSTKNHWENLFTLQDIRNHLVHYGTDFSEADEHIKRCRKFSKTKYVTLNPAICFSLDQLQTIFDLYMDCINDFIHSP